VNTKLHHEALAELGILLVHAKLPPERAKHWQGVFAPQVDPSGTIRTVSGEPLVGGLEEAVRLVMEAEAKAALPSQSHDVGPTGTNSPEQYFGALREKIIAERERQAAQPRTLQTVLQRLENPLSEITPGN
jgi:hypothetical protein